MVSVGGKFGREATVYLAGLVVAGAIQFLAIPVYTRALGPEQYGQLILTVAVSSVLAGVMVVGGDVALARFWADARTEIEKRELASTWIAFLTVWSIVVAGLAAVLAPRLAATLEGGSNIAPLLVLGILGLIPTQFSRMLAQVLRNRFRPVPYAISTAVIAGLDAVLGVLLGVVFDLGVAGILLGVLVGEAIGSLGLLVVVRRSLAWSFDRGLLRPMLRFGIPLVPASIAAWVFTGADRLMVNASAPPGELGGYGLAATLVSPFMMTTFALGQAWIPRIAGLNSKSRPHALRATSQGIVLALCGLGVAAIGVGVLAPWLIEFVGGGGFDTGASALPFLAVGAAFYGTAVFTGTGLTLEKRTWALLLSTVTAACVDIALLFVLVPLWGAVGAAVSVAGAYLALLWVSLGLASRVFPLQVEKRWLVLMTLVLVTQQALSTTNASVVVTAAGAIIASGALALLARVALRKGGNGSPAAALPGRRVEDALPEDPSR